MVFKKSKFGSKGKKRKNMPGYHLGVDKIGRRAWLADIEIKKVVDRKKYLYDEMQVGDIVKIGPNTNVTILGKHQGLAVIFDPTTAHVRLTSFAKQASIVLRKNIDVFTQYPSLLNRKIMGTNVTVKELSKNVNPPLPSSQQRAKTIAATVEEPTPPHKIGDTVNLVSYHPHAVIGDVLINSKGNDWTVVGVTKEHLVVKSEKLLYPYAIKVSNKQEYEIKKLGQELDPPLQLMQKKVQAASKFIDVPGQSGVKHTLQSFLLQEGGHVTAPHLKKVKQVAQPEEKKIDDTAPVKQDVQAIIAGLVPASLDNWNDATNTSSSPLLSTEKQAGTLWLTMPSTGVGHKMMPNASVSLSLQSAPLQKFAALVGINAKVKVEQVQIGKRQGKIYSMHKTPENAKEYQQLDTAPNSVVQKYAGTTEAAEILAFDVFMGNASRATSDFLISPDKKLFVRNNGQTNPYATSGYADIVFQKAINGEPVTLFRLAGLSNQVLTSPQRDAFLQSWNHYANMTDATIETLAKQIQPEAFLQPEHKEQFVEFFKKQRDTMRSVYEQYKPNDTTPQNQQQPAQPVTPPTSQQKVPLTKIEQERVYNVDKWAKGQTLGKGFQKSEWLKHPTSGDAHLIKLNQISDGASSDGLTTSTPLVAPTAVLEKLASLLGDATNTSVNKVFFAERSGKLYSLHQSIDGTAQGLARTMVQLPSDARQKILTQAPEAARIAVLDAFMVNVDRHTSNLMLDKNDKLVAIDNSYCIPIDKHNNAQVTKQMLQQIVEQKQLTSFGKFIPTTLSAEQRNAALESWRKYAELTDVEIKQMFDSMPDKAFNTSPKPYKKEELINYFKNRRNEFKQAYDELIGKNTIEQTIPQTTPLAKEVQTLLTSSQQPVFNVTKQFDPMRLDKEFMEKRFSHGAAGVSSIVASDVIRDHKVRTVSIRTNPDQAGPIEREYESYFQISKQHSTIGKKIEEFFTTSGVDVTQKIRTANHLNSKGELETKQTKGTIVWADSLGGYQGQSYNNTVYSYTDPQGRELIYIKSSAQALDGTIIVKTKKAGEVEDNLRNAFQTLNLDFQYANKSDVERYKWRTAAFGALSYSEYAAIPRGASAATYKQAIEEKYKKFNVKQILEDDVYHSSHSEFAPMYTQEFYDKVIRPHVKDVYHRLSNSRVTNFLREGCGLQSTVSRFLQGVMIHGMSSTMDIETGGAASIFTRLSNQREDYIPGEALGVYQPHETYTAWSLRFKPEIMRRANAYSYADDSYGVVDSRYMKKKPAFRQKAEKRRPAWEIAEKLPYGSSYVKKQTANETMFHGGVNLSDVEEITVQYVKYGDHLRSVIDAYAQMTPEARARTKIKLIEIGSSGTAKTIKELDDNLFIELYDNLSPSMKQSKPSSAITQFYNKLLVPF